VIAQSLLRPITCVVMPFRYCRTCGGARFAVGSDETGWRCAICHTLHPLADRPPLGGAA
jgi:hypothetical protein